MASLGSRYFQIVNEFAKAIAAQHGQTLVRVPGPRAGWKAQGVAGVPDIAIHWKREGLSANDKPPRIVCVAAGGEFGVVDQPGGGPGASGTRAVGAVRQNTIAVRRFAIQCYVWGQDDEQSEDLFYNAVRAFRHLFSDAKQPGKAPLFSSEVWEDELPNAGGQSTHGSLISFFATFEIVIPDPPDKLVIVTSIDNKLFFNQNEAEAVHVIVP